MSYQPKRVGTPFEEGREARIRELEETLARLDRRAVRSESQPRDTSGEGMAALVVTGGGGGGGASSLSGDVTGPAGNNTVVAAQNQDLAAGTTAGELWYFNGTAWVLLTPTSDDNLKVLTYVHASTAPAYRTLPYPVRTETGNYTATAHDMVILVDTSGGAVTVTLPAVAGTEGRSYVIKKITTDANAVTVDGDSGDLIDGATTYVITAPYESITILSTGSAWWVV